jgi:hypothetical protein
VPSLLVLSALGQFRTKVGAGNVRIKVARPGNLWVTDGSQRWD